MRYRTSKKLDFCKVFDDFHVFVSPRVFKIEHFFFLHSVDDKKNSRGYHIPMIDLGKSKKVTDV